MVLNIGKLLVLAINLVLLACVSGRHKSYFEIYPCSENECSREKPYCRVVLEAGCFGQRCNAYAKCYTDVERPVQHKCMQGLPIEYINHEPIRCNEDQQCPRHTRCVDPPSRYYAEGEKPRGGRGPLGTCCWDSFEKPSYY